MAIEEAIARKQAAYDDAVRHRDEVQEALDGVPVSDLNTAFKLRTELSQANLKVNQCATELEGVERRLKSGIEEKNSWDLQREALRALAAMLVCLPPARLPDGAAPAVLR